MDVTTHTNGFPLHQQIAGNISVRTAQQDLIIISMCSRDVEWDRTKRIDYNSNVFQAPQ